MGGVGDGDDDPDREAILARRRKMIAVALAGLTSAAGCGSEAEPTACLRMATDSGPVDSGPRDSGMDAEPMPCLDIAIDAGDPDAGDALDAGEVDGSVPDGSTDAAEPMPCLTPKAMLDDDDGEASA